MRRILALVAFVCFSLQQFTCCCGNLHGFEQLMAGLIKEAHASSNEHEDHDHSRHEHHGCPEDSRQAPCCPEGPHLCAVTHVFAVSESRVVLNHSLELCVWGAAAISSSGEVAFQSGQELQDSCDSSPPRPTLERLCAYLI